MDYTLDEIEKLAEEHGSVDESIIEHYVALLPTPRNNSAKGRLSHIKHALARRWRHDSQAYLAQKRREYIESNHVKGNFGNLRSALQNQKDFDTVLRELDGLPQHVEYARDILDSTWPNSARITARVYHWGLAKGLDNPNATGFEGVLYRRVDDLKNITSSTIKCVYFVGRSSTLDKHWDFPDSVEKVYARSYSDHPLVERVRRINYKEIAGIIDVQQGGVSDA